MCSRILTRKIDDDYVYVDDDDDVDGDVDVDDDDDGVVDVHDHDDDSTLCSRILTADEWEQECRPILEILDTRSFTNNCQNNCQNNCRNNCQNDFQMQKNGPPEMQQMLQKKTNYHCFHGMGGGGGGRLKI